MGLKSLRVRLDRVDQRDKKNIPGILPAKKKYKRQRTDLKEEEWRSQHPSGSLGTAHWSGSQGSNTERPWLGASGALHEGELACKQSLQSFIVTFTFHLLLKYVHFHVFLYFLGTRRYH